MQLVILIDDNGDSNAPPLVLDVPHDADTDLLMQLIHAELGQSMLSQRRRVILESEGVILNAGLLVNFGIVDGSTITLRYAPSASTQIPANSSLTSSSGINNSSGMSIYNIPADITPESLLSLVQSNPSLLQQFRSNDPDLGAVLATGDLSKVRSLMMKRFMERHKDGYTKQQELAALAADPMNPELQRKIEERVRTQHNTILFLFVLE